MANASTECAALPGGQRRHVALLAPGGDGGAGLGGGEAGGDRLAVCWIGAGEHQVALDAVPHDETRIGGERFVHEAHGVDVVFQIVLHRAIEQRSGLRAVGGEFHAACITVHTTPPIPRPSQADDGPS